MVTLVRRLPNVLTNLGEWGPRLTMGNLSLRVAVPIGSGASPWL